MQSVVLGDADTVRAELQAGASGKAGLAFKFADGKTQEIAGIVKPDQMQRTVEKDGKKVQVGTVMPDAFIEFKGAELTFKNHVRPNLVRYTEKQREDLVLIWETMPTATQHWTPVEVRALSAGAELWMEGRYCGRIASESRLAEVTFKTESGGAVRSAIAMKRADTGMFLPLDVQHIANLFSQAAVTDIGERLAP